MSKIVEPTKEDELLLNSLMENEADEVTIRGTSKSYRVKWLKYETRRRLSRLALKDDDDLKRTCKAAAMIVLNDFWRLTFWYWFLWRWFYYVRQYTENQLLPLLIEGKKKVPQEAFLTATMLVIGMRDTMMTMTKEEVEHFLREQRGGKPTT